MKVTFNAHARAEVREAYDHYEAISAVLLQRFTRQLVHTLQSITDMPTAWTPVARRTRRRNMRRFPYGVIYQVTETGIRVVALAHHKRRAGYWRKRLRD